MEILPLPEQDTLSTSHIFPASPPSCKEAVFWECHSGGVGEEFCLAWLGLVSAHDPYFSWGVRLPSLVLVVEIEWVTTQTAEEGFLEQEEGDCD